MPAAGGRLRYMHATIAPARTGCSASSAKSTKNAPAIEETTIAANQTVPSTAVKK